ncbi:MAG TPA: LysE family translocator [Vicinamibacterales bacterium]|nr:LysE family translocator [Vicinamibacterales bacterium]
MIGVHHLLLFIVSGLLLNLTPGQDTLFIVGRTLSQGRRAGLLSVLGISSGSVIHTLAAAFGLSAILATSAMAFTVVKLAGAAYLMYLGVKMMIEARAPLKPGPAASAPRVEGVARRASESDIDVYRSGLLTNVLNPKVALFFMAFLPQFVDPAHGSRVLSFLALGAIFIFNGTLWCLVLVWGAATMSRRLREHGSTGVWLKRATGAVFVGLGARLAVSR